MYAVSDAVISALSLVTLIYVIYASSTAFKKHYMNVFSYLMLILIVASLSSTYLPNSHSNLD